MLRLLAIGWLSAACFLLTAYAASAATLRADYQFAGSLDSSCCGAPALTNVGAGASTFAQDAVGGAQQTVLAFPAANGLELASSAVTPADSYSVAVRFRLDALGGYRRIAAFKDVTVDGGLYNLNGQLSFYPVVTGTSDPLPLAANTYAQAVITRDAATKQVTGYVDGVQQFSFTDSSDDAAIGPAGVIRFFKDDDAVGGEESGGAVARIRVWDGPLTAAEVAALEPPKTLADLPAPVLGQQVNVGPVSGQVRVAVPSRGAHASQKGLRFVPLTEARQIPTGSILDTQRGTVELRSATDSRTKLQSGRFTSGIFQVLQSRKRREKGLTELRLKGASFNRCRGRGASAAGLSKRTIRSLRGNAKGRFRTRGKHSAATVRGTVWVTTDRCDGTLTKVSRGRVAVRDFRRKKTVIVRAGKSYLAKARR